MSRTASQEFVLFARKKMRDFPQPLNDASREAVHKWIICEYIASDLFLDRALRKEIHRRLLRMLFPNKTYERAQRRRVSAIGLRILKMVLMNAGMTAQAADEDLAGRARTSVDALRKTLQPSRVRGSKGR